MDRWKAACMGAEKTNKQRLCRKKRSKEEKVVGQGELSIEQKEEKKLLSKGD